jgi:regulator of sigma E protease
MTAITYVFAFVLMLSVLIFVHELGHFLVARWCGVRVLKFCMGFGPPIGFGRHRLAWKRNGTEYAIAWFPLGGFVKMLGENPDEVDDPEVHAHPTEALGAKPLWQKLSIVFAGPLMNLLLPVLIFAVTLGIGMPRPAPVIGSVEADSPAAQAGLAAGDRILAVNDAPVRWWGDVEDAVRARPGEAVVLRFERAGASGEARFSVSARPGLDEFGKVREMGWVGLGHRRLTAMVGVPSAEGPAHRAGLRSGDTLVSVAGAAVEDWPALARAYAAAQGTVAVEVQRGVAPDAQKLALELPALGSLDALGVVPANVLVSSVEAGSPAERGGLARGDLILSVDGALVGSFMSFAETVRTSEGRPLELVYARDGRLEHTRIAPELAPIDVGLGIEETRYRVGVTAEAATLAGAVELDQVRNPLVAVPRAAAMTVDVTHMFLRGLAKIATGEVSRKQVAGPIGIAQIAGNALQRGWETYLSTLVLISINLGILNLLPIPILDGGQAVLFLAEGIKRSPLSLRTRLVFQQIGLTVLVLLMGMAFWNDISRHWSKVVDWLRSGTGL